MTIKDPRYDDLFPDDLPPLTPVDDDVDGTDDSPLGTLLLDGCGALLDAHGKSPAHDHPGFTAWLETDARARQRTSEKAATARHANDFARRMRARIAVARVTTHVPMHPLRARNADIFGTIGQVADDAKRARCAPWLDSLAVAAGAGLELWDEPCERWVELPPTVPLAQHVALNVVGDSMQPFLEPGDVLLVHVGAPVKEGKLIVALHPGHGYVVKYVAGLTREAIELESFNTRYAPFQIARDRRLVVGVVSHVLKRGD